MAVFILVAAGLVGVSLVATVRADAGAIGVSDYKPIATDVDPATCADLGRAWTTYDGVPGCSRTRCVHAGARISGDYNTEACSLGKDGWAANVESRTCQVLHRRWVPVVNRCLGEVARVSGSTVVNDARSCRAPSTTYVFMPANRGEDICIQPRLAARFAGEARRTHTSVAAVAFSHERSLCSMVGSYEWQGGQCRHLRPGHVRDKLDRPVLVMGDSVTWRAADEITSDAPTWEVDGQPGTALQSAGMRYRTYAQTHVAPKVFVLALGTNGNRRGVTRSDWASAVNLVPDTTRVVLVTPYRDRIIYPYDTGRLRTVVRSMNEVARDRPGTCLAPWHDTVERRPELLVDGVHETASGEQVFADVIARTVAACR